MTSQPPHLQLSDTDGIGPLKRRRPALSCVECRRRKVKCDRQKPCGPCTRVKSSTCTFRPNPRSVNRPTMSPVAGSISQDSSDQSSPQITSQTTDLVSLITPSVALGNLGPHENVLQNHLPNPRSNTLIPDYASTIGFHQDQSSAAIRSLEQKVRELEGRLGSIREEPPSRDTVLPTRPIALTTPGQLVKSRFYGESHWMNAIEPYEALGKASIITNPSNNRTEINRSSDLYMAVLECKRMARTIKSNRIVRWSLPPEVQASLPAKHVCDQLIQCYLRTFEGVFRVLHIPTFLKECDEYWKNPSTTKPSVLMKMLLACAIGVSFYLGEGQARLRGSCTKWIQAAEQWLSAPHEKSRLNLTGIQIHILLLFARQIRSVDGDLVWISAGSLLRTAMHVGLHRDPSHFPKITPFDAEMRRRLWATVLELTVQTSLDMGMPPMLSIQDFDTRPPANINDENIGESVSASLDPRPVSEFSQTSVQIALRESLPLRLEITLLVNNLHSDISYDDTLRLGNELSMICRSKARLFQGFLVSSPGTTTFQVKMLDTLVRRFIINLHRSFFVKAKTDPKYYYSRKVCVDASMAILGPASQLRSGEEDDWEQLKANGVGFAKSIFLYSVTTFYLELLSMIEERRNEIGLEWPSQPLTDLPPHFDVLRNVLVKAKEIAVLRIQNGETNAKGSVFLSCALSRVDALVSGTDADKAVLDTARKTITETAALMRQAYKEETGLDAELGPHSRFDIEHGGVDVALIAPGGGDGTTGVAGAGCGDMDWETLVQDNNMDFGFEFEGNLGQWIFGGLESVGGMSG